jgi:hypothetical protein
MQILNFARTRIVHGPEILTNTMIKFLKRNRRVRLELGTPRTGGGGGGFKNLFGVSSPV